MDEKEVEIEEKPKEEQKHWLIRLLGSIKGGKGVEPEVLSEFDGDLGRSIYTIATIALTKLTKIVAFLSLGVKGVDLLLMLLSCP